METEFKIGDKVRNPKGCGDIKAGKVYTVELRKGRTCLHISEGVATCNCEGDWELVKNYKPKKPTHLVVWKEDSDPCQFFNGLYAATQFIRKLSEKPNVEQDSIVLVEIKSCKKVEIIKKVSKTLKFDEHKI